MKPNIKYSIVSRGRLALKYDDKELNISGELTFEPAVFYADLSSLKSWNKPESTLLSETEKDNILNYFEIQNRDSKNTKVLFD